MSAPALARYRATRAATPHASANTSHRRVAASGAGLARWLGVKRFHDTTDGIWRRQILLPFEQVCPVEKRDPGLKGRQGRLRAALIAAQILLTEITRPAPP